MTVKFMLAEIRMLRGLTQEELAHALNMSLTGLQYLEYQAKAVKLDLLDQLCEVLECTPGDLLKRFDGEIEEERRFAKAKQRQEKSERMKRWWAEKKKQGKNHPSDSDSATAIILSVPTAPKAVADVS